MANDSEIVERHVGALLAEAAEAQVPVDVVGRLLVHKAIEIWSRARDWQDIERELAFIAESLDPDTDFTFMRP